MGAVAWQCPQDVAEAGRPGGRTGDGGTLSESPETHSGSARFHALHPGQPRLYSQLWRSVSVRRENRNRFCRVRGQSSNQQTVCEETADAVDKKGRGSHLTSPHQSAEQGITFDLRAMVHQDAANPRGASVSCLAPIL